MTVGAFKQAGGEKNREKKSGTLSSLLVPFWGTGLSRFLGFAAGAGFGVAIVGDTRFNNVYKNQFGRREIEMRSRLYGHENEL